MTVPISEAGTPGRNVVLGSRSDLWFEPLLPSSVRQWADRRSSMYAEAEKSNRGSACCLEAEAAPCADDRNSCGFSLIQLWRKAEQSSVFHGEEPHAALSRTSKSIAGPSSHCRRRSFSPGHDRSFANAFETMRLLSHCMAGSRCERLCQISFGVKLDSHSLGSGKTARRSSSASSFTMVSEAMARKSEFRTSTAAVMK